MAFHRIWTESLSMKELASNAVISMLERYRIQPLIAWQEAQDCSSILNTLQCLGRANISIGLWPLLSDDDGYWPSVSNAKKFANWVSQILSMTTATGISVTTMAIDLEPKEALKRQLTHASFSVRADVLWTRNRMAKSPAAQFDYRQATACYSGLAHKLTAHGIESLAIVVPPVLLDVFLKSQRWQELLEIPVTTPNWSTLSPMMYSSMIRSLLPNALSKADSFMLRKSCRVIKKSTYSSNSCMSLGVVGRGKMQDEVCYSESGELMRDVDLVRSEGITDLALFSLEGVLARKDPEAWFEAFVG